MAFNLRCKNPDCRKLIRVKDAQVGKRLKCPGCGHVISVPEEPPEDAPSDQPPPKSTASRTPSRVRGRRWSWVAGCGCFLFVGAILLGGGAAEYIFGIQPLKPVDPLDNVLNDRLIWHGFGVSPNPQSVEPSFLVGFEKAKWPSESRDVSIKLQQGGTSVLTMRSNHGSHVWTTPDQFSRTQKLQGTLTLGDGRTIQLDRVYEYNKDGTITIRDKSITTDRVGQELRNNLVESIDDRGRIVSVEGLMTSSLTGEHKINRTYTYITDPEYRVRHNDN